MLELYPRGWRPTSGLRVGLIVPDVRAVVDAVRASGAEVVRAALGGPEPFAVLADPDGHEIALAQG